MAKKVTFSLANESTINCIDDYAQLSGMSRSAVIALLLDATTPLLGNMVSHHHAAEKVKSYLLQACQLVNSESIRYKPEMSKEEHYTNIWDGHIKYPHQITDRDFSNHKINTSKMGLSEREAINLKLKGYIKQFSVIKAIFVYTDRLVTHSHHLAGGISNTILIKETTFDDFIYDFSSIVTLPSKDLIFFGIDGAMKRRNIHPQNPCVCWVPIYHTNNQTVMIPVIHKDNAPASAKNNCDTIIINPFKMERDN